MKANGDTSTCPRIKTQIKKALFLMSVCAGTFALSGCATNLYLKGDPDPDVSGCESRATINGACRFVEVEPYRSEQPYLTAKVKTVRTYGGFAGLLFEWTPLGIAAPMFGYLGKSDPIYTGEITLITDPPGAAPKTGLRHTFEVSRGESADWMLDFNAGAREVFKKTGRVTVYKPGLLKVSVRCNKNACSVTSIPPVLAPDGTVKLAAKELEDANRLRAIAAEELRLKKEKDAADRNAAKRKREEEEARLDQERKERKKREAADFEAVKFRSGEERKEVLALEPNKEFKRVLAIVYDNSRSLWLVPASAYQRSSYKSGVRYAIHVGAMSARNMHIYITPTQRQGVYGIRAIPDDLNYLSMVGSMPEEKILEQSIGVTAYVDLQTGLMTAWAQ